MSCISFLSYIKPQRRTIAAARLCVVYHSFPTSNHNFAQDIYAVTHVVYHSFPTSNHNLLHEVLIKNIVVYHSFPTSNHNMTEPESKLGALYIIPFLHQTTTLATASNCAKCCISFLSYIKPQRLAYTG